MLIPSLMMPSEEMICGNLRSETPPIDYPFENRGFEGIRSVSPSKMNLIRNGGGGNKMMNGDTDDNQEQVAVYVDGRRIVKKKKRQCIKCKFPIRFTHKHYICTLKKLYDHTMLFIYIKTCYLFGKRVKMINGLLIFYHSFSTINHMIFYVATTLLKK